MMRLIRPSVKIVPPIPAISIVTAKVNLSTVYAPFRCKSKIIIAMSGYDDVKL